MPLDEPTQPDHDVFQATSILKRRERVAEMYLEGNPMRVIAETIGMHISSISLDIKAMKAAWRERSHESMDDWTAEQLARIDKAESQAWISWEKSKLDDEASIVEKTEEAGDAGKTKTKVKKTKRGQAGDPRFLDIVLKCVQKRCDLLGLDAPKQLDMQVGGIGMEELIGLLEADRTTVIDASFVEAAVEQAASKLKQLEAPEQNGSANGSANGHSNGESNGYAE